MEHETIFLLSLLSISILGFLMGLFYAKKMFASAAMCLFLLLMAILFCYLEREKESRGNPVTEKFFSHGEKWEILKKPYLNARLGVWLKNTENGKIKVFSLKEMPPERFKVHTSGFWKWRKVRFIPVEDKEEKK